MNCIVVKSSNSKVKTVPMKDGTKLHFNEQTCAIETGDEFPRPFKITLEDNQEPYPPGRYTVDPSSFQVDKYDNLMLGRRVRLLPLAKV